MLVQQYEADAPEVPASWFSVLNSLFIIIFAPLFSKLWESKYNPSAAVNTVSALFYWVSDFYLWLMEHLIFRRAQKSLP